MVTLRHVHEGALRAVRYHGSGREDIAKHLSDADIVITTYETLRVESAASKRSPLYSWQWFRVVLDEGQHSPVELDTSAYHLDFLMFHSSSCSKSFQPGFCFCLPTEGPLSVVLDWDAGPQHTRRLRRLTQLHTSLPISGKVTVHGLCCQTSGREG